jgi:hypothetical protein
VEPVEVALVAPAPQPEPTAQPVKRKTLRQMYEDRYGPVPPLQIHIPPG